MQTRSTATAAQALEALDRGDAAQAREMLEALLADKPDVALWLALARAKGALGDTAGEMAAIDGALTIEPQHLGALVAKADLLERNGDRRAAAAFYQAALKYLPQYARLPAAAQADLRRAKTANEQLARELADFITGRLESAVAGAPPPRLARAVDIMLGRRRAYPQQPRYLFYPELASIQFFDRALFPWLDAVEAATGDICAELEALLGGAGRFEPYLQQPADRPKRDQKGLVGNPDWGAFFLYKDGKRLPGADLCPRTMAALDGAPLARIPNKAPSILFSKLAAGAHIPPHTGMTNTRLICHLPLIVPEGCDFRVGNEQHAWAKAKAWVFDDTIEHEAWNRSSEDRYILLFDIWRPDLGAEERRGVAALCEAIDSFAGAPMSWDA